CTCSPTWDARSTLLPGTSRNVDEEPLVATLPSAFVSVLPLTVVLSLSTSVFTFELVCSSLPDDAIVPSSAYTPSAACWRRHPVMLITRASSALMFVRDFTVLSCAPAAAG